MARLEPVGWNFGLGRMRALCAELGEPQRGYRSLHVVGTNGKSSVTAMAAAVLESGGLRTGACLSPHAERWSERIRIGGSEIAPDEFADAIEEVSAAVTRVEGRFGEGERITQFEAAIAASFVAFARAGVEIAVVEAGLGGRLDATNVIPSIATALTSVGLDHTQWLGETELEIAAEKLAVLREGSALVLGDVGPEVRALAVRTAAERGAELIEPSAPAEEGVGRPPAFVARNAAVAVALARVAEPRLDAAAVADGLARAALPGRAELIDGDPPLIVDAAHNEQGALALAEALPGLAGGRPIVGCLSVLAEKDVAAIARALAPALTRAVCTAADPGPAMGRPGAVAADPETVAGALGAAGCDAEVEADPSEAVIRALALARERQGVALCAGSHYLLRYAWTLRHARNSSR